MATLSGTIKRLVTDRGFGFVKGADGKEYFFHRSAAASFDSLTEGQAVSFEEDASPKGPRAKNITAA